MIKDDRVDLTPKRKFKPRSVSMHTLPVWDELGGIKYKRVVPWKIKPMKVISSPVRMHNGDRFSDDLGMLVRRKSNNDLWLISLQKMNYPKEVLSEYKYEIGFNDGDLLKYCPACGKRFMSRHQYELCDSCRPKPKSNKLNKAEIKNKPDKWNISQWESAYFKAI